MGCNKVVPTLKDTGVVVCVKVYQHKAKRQRLFKENKELIPVCLERRWRLVAQQTLSAGYVVSEVRLRFL